MRDDPRTVFRRIYETAHWHGGSGQGSRAEVTADYRRVVERLIGASDVQSVVDAGCGDWEFARLVDWTPVSYIGVDVVPEVIATNNSAFGSPNVAFECRDLAKDSLPDGDVLLCKDVLQHWPLAQIESFLTRVIGGFRYVLLTNDVSSVHSPLEMQNADIDLGAWRTLDLERAPFALTADWRFDYDIRGEWVKRMLLFVRPRHRIVANVRHTSGLRRLRAAD